jgi:hypothetical protein
MQARLQYVVISLLRLRSLWSLTQWGETQYWRSARIWYVKNVFVFVNTCVHARESALPSFCVCPLMGLNVALGWHLREGVLPVTLDGSVHPICFFISCTEVNRRDVTAKRQPGPVYCTHFSSNDQTNIRCNVQYRQHRLVETKNVLLRIAKCLKWLGQIQCLQFAYCTVLHRVYRHSSRDCALCLFFSPLRVSRSI